MYGYTYLKKGILVAYSRHCIFCLKKRKELMKILFLVLISVSRSWVLNRLFLNMTQNS
jgi:hypothetical protein